MTDRELGLEEEKLKIQEINTLGIILNQTKPDHHLNSDDGTFKLRAKVIKKLENLIDQ